MATKSRGFEFNESAREGSSGLNGASDTAADLSEDGLFCIEFVASLWI
jgi:hypothetical protein